MSTELPLVGNAPAPNPKAPANGAQPPTPAAMAPRSDMRLLLGAASLDEETQAHEEQTREFLGPLTAGGLAVALSALFLMGLERGLWPALGDWVALQLVVVGLAGVLTVSIVEQGARRKRRNKIVKAARRARHELVVQQGIFESILDHTPAGMWVLDEEYRVLFANAEARRIHGHDVMLGERYPCEAAALKEDFVCPTCPAKHTLTKCEPAKKRGYRTEKATGEIVAVETHPIQLEGGGAYALIVERTVTEHQRLQASLVHREKMAAFGLLSAGIAHDLGNPLAGIEMHLQLLGEETLPEDASESIETVKREVARLRRTLRGLVDFARRRGTETSLTSIKGVVDDALGLLRYDQRMRKVEVVVEADPDTPLVDVVEDHLMQVSLNLMLNSLDAMPEGGKLRLEIRKTDEGAALRVHDSGVGMSRKVTTHCCEAFFTTKATGQGAGLGLSMARELIRAAGGELELHSAPNKGTTAIVSLPAAVVDEADPARGTSEATTAEAAETFA